MGENGVRRHLRAAAVVSLAVFVASCGGRRDAAPVIMNGAAPQQVETVPMAPMPRSPRPQQAVPSGPGQRIVVRPGQTVGYLAREYGVTRKAIIEANNLTPPDYKIEIGRTLVIPGSGSPGRDQTRAPVNAAAAEKPPTPPAPDRPVAAGPGRKAPEIIPLDDPAPTPARSAKASAVNVPAPAVAGQGRLAPPAEPAARSVKPAEAEGVSAQAEPAARSGGRLPWPVRGRVLAGYGATKGGGNNAGINIAAARGAPVRSVDSGVVAYAGNEVRGYGNLVLVKHPSGFISAYAHLDEMQVKRGDTVGGGQVIGKVGDTGGVGEPQLHFELRRGQKAVDPREFLTPAPNAGGGAGGSGS
jgi:murein DD-endopeptidase MepM/ murein hydrolase activator NlpD